MKHPFALCLQLLVIHSMGQELVPDPGFEIANCDNYPQLEHWFNPNAATPDVITTDGCGVLLTDDLLSLGYAQAFEGNKYIGLFCCYPVESSVQTREYLTTALEEIMEGGTVYEVSFRLRRLSAFDLAIDRIGVYFSNEAPMDTGFEVLDVEPQFETDGNILQPDSIWELIEFSYEAAGAENFLTIGNFRWPDEMVVLDTGSSSDDSNNAYYFFDEVHVQKTNTVMPLLASTLTFFMHNHQLMINNGGNDQYECSFYDEKGGLLIAMDLQVGSNQIPVPVNVQGLIVCVRSRNEKLVRKFVTG